LDNVYNIRLAEQGFCEVCNTVCHFLSMASF
jgi:hypothetical protein